jgi:glutamine amidotransferase-like uncharacterized protein
MKTLAIFTHDPECSDECVDGLVAALYPHYNVKLFDETEFKRETFEGVDLVVFGGGIGDADAYYDFIKRREGNIVAEFVEGGGRYLGICMGAYWAGFHYFDILSDIAPHQYIKRPNADIRRPYATTAQIDWMGIPQKMFFYDGPTFEGKGKASVIAKYANGDPMAIIQGRVGLIGCHPESEKHWYNRKYLSKNWHHGYHHTLLLEFVNQLFKQ